MLKLVLDGVGDALPESFMDRLTASLMNETVSLAGDFSTRAEINGSHERRLVLNFEYPVTDVDDGHMPVGVRYKPSSIVVRLGDRGPNSLDHIIGTQVIARYPLEEDQASRDLLIHIAGGEDVKVVYSLFPPKIKRIVSTTGALSLVEGDVESPPPGPASPATRETPAAYTPLESIQVADRDIVEALNIHRVTFYGWRRNQQRAGKIEANKTLTLDRVADYLASMRTVGGVDRRSAAMEAYKKLAQGKGADPAEIESAIQRVRQRKGTGEISTKEPRGIEVAEGEPEADLASPHLEGYCTIEELAALLQKPKSYTRSSMSRAGIRNKRGSGYPLAKVVQYLGRVHLRRYIRIHKPELEKKIDSWIAEKRALFESSRRDAADPKTVAGIEDPSPPPADLGPADASPKEVGAAAAPSPRSVENRSGPEVSDSGGKRFSVQDISRRYGGRPIKDLAASFRGMGLEIGEDGISQEDLETVALELEKTNRDLAEGLLKRFDYEDAKIKAVLGNVVRAPKTDRDLADSPRSGIPARAGVPEPTAAEEDTTRVVHYKPGGSIRYSKISGISGVGGNREIERLMKGGSNMVKKGALAELTFNQESGLSASAARAIRREIGLPEDPEKAREIVYGSGEPDTKTGGGQISLKDLDAVYGHLSKHRVIKSLADNRTIDREKLLAEAGSEKSKLPDLAKTKILERYGTAEEPPAGDTPGRIPFREDVVYRAQDLPRIGDGGIKNNVLSYLVRRLGDSTVTGLELAKILARGCHFDTLRRTCGYEGSNGYLKIRLIPDR